MARALPAALLALALQVAAAPPPAVQDRLAAGRAALQAGDRFTALRHFGEARRLAPDDPEVRRAVADVLVELGGVHGAAAALGPPPDLGLRSRQAAARVRWGAQVDAATPAQRFADTDAALAELDALIAQADALQPPDPGLLQRLRRDRTVALRDRERWADAVAQAQQLREAGDPLPPYVRQAESDALLALRRPEDAARGYDAVLAAEPGNRDARIGRFYAAVELEDAATAFAIADALAAQGAPLKRVGVQAQPSPDWEWLDAQLLAAQARRFFDMPGPAWRRVQPLAAQAPASAGLRLELGETAAARGWDRHADTELRIAASLAPDDVGVQLALADSEFRRRDWAAAQARADAIGAVAPGNEGLRRLRGELAAHRDAQLQFALLPRVERGGGARTPGDSVAATLRAYTPPLRERWRVLGALESDRTRPDERRLRRDRVGVGVEGRWPDLTVEAIAWDNRGELARAGASLQWRWTPDDHWGIGGDLQAFTAETPARALQAGIHADAAGLTLDYDWHEARAFGAAVRTLRFSDGNRRWQGQVGTTALLLDRPHLELRLRPSLYASRNRRVDTPYFSPREDAALDLSLELRHVPWRRYERQLTQTLVASAGSYWQRGFTSGATWALGYGQSWRHDPRLQWDYGVELASRRYDGDSERALGAYLRLDRRF